MPIINFSQPAYDADASTYFTTAGVTSTAGKQQISRFVTGVKDLGLWSNMVCWPLRSSQNPGIGTTVYSLGGYGTYNGTLSSSELRTTDGLAITSGSTYMSTSLTLGAYPDSIIAVTNILTDIGANKEYLFTAGVNVNGRQFSIGTSGVNDLDHLFAQRDVWYTLASDLGYAYNTFGIRAGPRYISWRPQSNTTFRATLNGNFLNGSATGWAASTAGQIAPRGNEGANTLGFFAYLNTAISDSLDNQIRSLYKTTLGQGLGLP